MSNHPQLVMFPNMIAPSPVYHSLFRAPALPGQHPGLAASTSFLMENLLRERQAHGLSTHPAGLLAPRPLLTVPPRLVPSVVPPGVQPPPAHSNHPRTATPPSPRSSPASPSSPPPDSVRDGSPPPRQPYLKFGVSAILSSQVSPKNGE